jgi:putative hydrolase of the HAD superfamily
MPQSIALAQTSPAPFDVIAFDLDDTLVDTSRLLIPAATRESCQAMIDAGLNASLDACCVERESLARHGRRGNIYLDLVSIFGTRGGVSPEMVAHAGHEAFLHRTIDPNLTLIQGVTTMLVTLSKKYRLFLVTAGHRTTQEEKIRILRLRPFFEKVFVVHTPAVETKSQAFASILSETGLSPARHLSVGNRVDSDVGEARALGWKGCLVRYGEHAELQPERPEEEPDFQVDHILELVAKCRL